MNHIIYETEGHLKTWEYGLTLPYKMVCSHIVDIYRYGGVAEKARGRCYTAQQYFEGPDMFRSGGRT
ncbi:MAG: hypothetical protein SV686_02255 [Thermodesulfobacteriota bacterium]|nr:hypothetical protein [Thermodesulfobacteriota bacterium]